MPWTNRVDEDDPNQHGRARKYCREKERSQSKSTKPSHVADFDDGTGTGQPDGGVTIDDLLYYLAVFEAGISATDLDDGSGTGPPDGGVTIDCSV